MTTIDMVPRTPVTVRGVLDDPELAWRLCEANGPYAHVLMLREFAASLDAYREAARRGSPDAIGVLVDDELMTMPIFRGDWVSSRVLRRALRPLNAATVGLLVMGVIKFLPYVGVWVWTAATLIGIGATLSTKFGRRELWFDLA